MGSPSEAWRAEHEYFERLLALLQAQFDVFHRGERPNYQLMLDIIGYLRPYGDACHHPREDVAFARLAARRPELKLPLLCLQQDHRVIARAGEKLEELLNEALADALLPRVEIEVAAATYLVYYGNHIAREDETVLGEAQTALTPEDWQAVRMAAATPAGPGFGELSRERYPELARHLD